MRIALVPCIRPTQIPVRLAWTPRASDLHPELLEAVLHSWERRYGALLLGLDTDSMLLVVPRPPATPAEAVRAAAEHAALGAHAWPAEDLVGAPVWRVAWGAST